MAWKADLKRFGKVTAKVICAQIIFPAIVGVTTSYFSYRHFRHNYLQVVNSGLDIIKFDDTLTQLNNLEKLSLDPVAFTSQAIRDIETDLNEYDRRGDYSLQTYRNAVKGFAILDKAFDRLTIEDQPMRLFDGDIAPQPSPKKRYHDQLMEVKDSVVRIGTDREISARVRKAIKRIEPELLSMANKKMVEVKLEVQRAKQELVDRRDAMNRAIKTFVSN